MGAWGRCHLHLLPLLILVIMELGISHASATTILRCGGTERKALMEFKRLLRDPSNRLSSWVGEDCCAWEGVGCSNTTGHVINLDLRNRNYTSIMCYLYDDSEDSELGCKQALRGDISPSLLSLQHLTHLDLSGNYFGHPIPTFLGSFTRLTYLNLSSAGFVGRVPDQLGNLSSLNYLDLSYNRYYGDDDDGNFLYLEDAGWISRLSSLRLLNMSRVNFSSASNWLPALNALPLVREVELAECDLGAFPRSLPHSNFTSLTTLNLRGNFINSTVPNWLLNITALEYLDLSWNYIYWYAPASVAKWTSLKALDLSTNVFISDDFLQGTLSKLCMLQSLYLWDVAINDMLSKLDVVFSGCLMFSLEELDLGYTPLNGSLPSWLENMRNLKYLALDSTSLNGSLPHWLGNMKNLEHLDLSSNSFYGSLPTSLGNLSSLQYLSLRFNNFNGSIVQGIQLDGSFLDWVGNMKNLDHLDLSSNSFYGSLPASFGNLSSLQYLDLSSNNFNGRIAQDIKLDGSFSDWLGNMKNLEVLDLSSNSFYGSLPASLGNLLSLQYLDLRSNNFNGRIAQDIKLDGSFSDWLVNMKKLKILDLSHNSFYGSLPASFGNLSSLQYLNMHSNKLNGSIGEGIPQLKSLIYLDLGNNSLNLFEAHLANLSSLQNLDVSHNTLVSKDGSDWIPTFQLRILDMSFCRIMPIPYFPQWLRTQTSLVRLHIENAGIKGMVPSWLPPSLRSLFLSNNEISGDLPQYFPNLTHLSLSNNSFSGQIPQRIADMMPNLELLDLSHNKLTGEVPSYFPNLIHMDLSNNSFSGHLSPRISQTMPNLSFIDLSMNNLIGSIPWSFCQNELLYMIQLSNNNFSGEIPNCWKNSSNGFFLDFSNNQLQGRIPDTICNPWSLHSLHLSHNNFSGEIPLSLRNCTSLVTLDLGYNSFSENIPTWLEESLPHLKTLNLRSNAFTGHIPGLSHLAQLQILDISNNHLSGCIPYSFGNFSALKSSPNHFNYFEEDKQRVFHPIYDDGIQLFLKGYASYYFVDMQLFPKGYASYYSDEMQLFLKGFEYEYKSLLALVTLIDLSNNNLSGPIPEGLGNLHGLRNLNLSGNYLAGEILEIISKIKELETLDLSRNNLSGAIPSSLASLYFLNHLNLSFNNLSGIIPTGNQFSTFNDPSIYEGNPYLCGPPLTKNCTEDTAKSNIASDEDEDDQGRIETIWLYTWVAFGFIAGFWTICGTLILKRRWRIIYFRAIDDAYDWLYVMVAVNMARIKRKLFIRDEDD